MITIVAIITYPCPSPFNCSQYPAQNTLIRIQLPYTTNIQSYNNATVSYQVGELKAGETVKVEFELMKSTNEMYNVTIIAGGIISGSDTAGYQDKGIFYPPYDYVDIIGGEIT